jgi:hypothetical protein
MMQSSWLCGQEQRVVARRTRGSIETHLPFNFLATMFEVSGCEIAAPASSASTTGRDCTMVAADQRSMLWRRHELQPERKKI